MKCRIYLLLVMKIEDNNISNFDDILRLVKRSFYPLQNDLMMSQQKTTQIFNSLQFFDHNLIHRSFFLQYANVMKCVPKSFMYSAHYRAEDASYKKNPQNKRLFLYNVVYV